MREMRRVAMVRTKVMAIVLIGTREGGEPVEYAERRTSGA